jgi:hypothetical protein
MKVLSWNCQGIGNPKTVRALKKLINTNWPDLVFLMESKVSGSNVPFLSKLDTRYKSHVIDYSTTGGGKAGGLILLWNVDNINVEIKDFSFNYIDVLILNLCDSSRWRATGIYGYPQHHNKYLTCRLINDLADTNVDPNWLLFGDFNMILANDEKWGGSDIDLGLASSFRNAISINNLQDLGYRGDIYTWTNR